MIVCDLDGTLLKCSDDSLSDRFITKIKNLTDCGIIFAVNSGRTYKDLKPLVNELKNRAVFMCNDGAQIMYKNCLIYKNAIPKETFLTLSGELLSNGYGVFAVLREQNKRVTSTNLAEKGAFSEEVYKIVVVKEPKGNDTEQKIKALAENLGLRLCYNDPYFMEFVTKTADKGAATAYLKERFGILKGVVAFGDGENDIPMFKCADTVYTVKGKNKVCFDGAAQIENVQEFIIENF